jgi:hypothetical protein
VGPGRCTINRLVLCVLILPTTKASLETRLVVSIRLRFCDLYGRLSAKVRKSPVTVITNTIVSCANQGMATLKQSLVFVWVLEPWGQRMSTLLHWTLRDDL